MAMTAEMSHQIDGGEDTDSRTGSLTVKIGTWMFVSWILVLGPAGFLLSCSLAYALHFSDPALGAVCALLLMSPVLFLCMWIPLLVASVLMEKKGSGSRSSLQESLRRPSQYMNRAILETNDKGGDSS